MRQHPPQRKSERDRGLVGHCRNLHSRRFIEGRPREALALASVFPLPRRAIGWEPGARRRKQVLPGAKSDRRIGLLRALMSALFAQQPGIPEPPGSPSRPPADPTAPPPREDRRGRSQYPGQMSRPGLMTRHPTVTRRFQAISVISKSREVAVWARLGPLGSNFSPKLYLRSSPEAAQRVNNRLSGDVTHLDVRSL